MKRLISCLAAMAGLMVSMSNSAEAGLFFGHRVVVRPARTVVVTPAYAAPVVPVAPVTPVVYTTPRVVYSPGYLAPAYYTPAYYAPAPVYYAPAAPVFVGW